MDYVHSAFYEATGWNRDNSYATLNDTSEGTLSPLPQMIVTDLSLREGC